MSDDARNHKPLPTAQLEIQLRRAVDDPTEKAKIVADLQDQLTSLSPRALTSEERMALSVYIERIVSTVAKGEFDLDRGGYSIQRVATALAHDGPELLKEIRRG